MTPQVGSGKLYAPDVFAALRKEAKSLWSSPVYVAEPPNPRPGGVFAVFTPSGGAEGPQHMGNEHSLPTCGVHRAGCIQRRGDVAWRAA